MKLVVTPRDLFADAREKADTLRRFGHPSTADALDAMLEAIATCPPVRELLTEHDEKGAVLLSGKPAGYFRSRFAGWAERGLARRGGRGQRYYSEVVIPKAAQMDDVLKDAERTAAADRVA